MRWRHTHVVYKKPDGYVVGSVSSSHQVALRQLSFSQPGGGGNKVDKRPRRLGKTNQPAVLLWPRSACIIKRVQLPPVEGEKLRAALRFELEGQLPFPAAEAALAVSAIGGEERQQKGELQQALAFCVRLSDVEQAVSELREDGVDVARVVPATLALAHSLPPSPGSCVHIEHRHLDTEAVLMVNNRLVASVWIGDDDPAILAGKVGLWWQGLERAGMPAPEKTTLRGGDQAFQAELTQRLASFVNVQVLPEAAAEGAGYKPLLAAGSMAAHWERAGDTELTPDGVQQTRDNARRKRNALIAVGVAACCLSLLVGVGNVAVSRQEALSKQLSTEWQAFAPGVKEETALKNERDALLKEANSWADVLEERADWAFVLQRLSAALPQGVWLTEVRMEKGKSYQITGNAQSSAAATLFVEQLRSAGAWGEAKLDLAKAVETTEQAMVSFAISGHLESKSGKR